MFFFESEYNADNKPESPAKPKQDDHLGSASAASATPDKTSDKTNEKETSSASNSGREKAMRLLEELNGEKEGPTGANNAGVDKVV